jgi:hypothetical protein
MPLGAKLPVIPGSNSIFYTTNISEKVNYVLMVFKWIALPFLAVGFETS